MIIYAGIITELGYLCLRKMSLFNFLFTPFNRKSSWCQTWMTCGSPSCILPWTLGRMQRQPKAREPRQSPRLTYCPLRGRKRTAASSSFCQIRADVTAISGVLFFTEFLKNKWRTGRQCCFNDFRRLIPVEEIFKDKTWRLCRGDWGFKSKSKCNADAEGMTACI